MKISHLFEAEVKDDFGAPIYHGSYRLEAGVYKQMLRVKPKSTYMPVHNTLSELSKEKFGIDVRSLMFCSMVQRNVKPYGKTFELLPMGNYRVFVADGVWDMTMMYSFLHQEYADGVMKILREHLDIVSYDLKDRIESFLLGLDMDTHNLTIKDTAKKLIEIFSEYQREENPEGELGDEDHTIIKELKGFFSGIQDNAEDYIGKVKEVKHANEIENKSSELMIYLPDGFQLLKATPQTDDEDDE